MLDQTHNPDRAATEARKSGSMKMGSFLVMVEIELIKKTFSELLGSVFLGEETGGYMHRRVVCTSILPGHY